MGCGCSNCSSSSCSTPTCGSCQCSTCPAATCTAVCTALEISNSWNVPACSASAILAVPGLTTVLIGSYIYNPTYGYFRISAFDSINGQITVVNDCWPENAAPGTVVPAGTTFIFGGPPMLQAENGWIAAGETWAYLSATSMTVPSDATTKYSIGDKILLYQGGVPKYFSVMAVAPTILTIYAGTDYVLTNTAITEPQYSHDETPVGFPPFFNYTVTATGFSVAPTGMVGQFRVLSKAISLSVRIPNAGTSNATTFTINAPWVAKTLANMGWGITLWQAEDNGVQVATTARAFINTGSSTITFETTLAGGAWTAANGKRGSFTNLVYEI